MALGLLGQGRVILSCAAQNRGLYFLPWTPSMKGLVLVGAEGEGKTNRKQEGS